MARELLRSRTVLIPSWSKSLLPLAPLAVLAGGCNNHALVGVHYDSSQVCGESLEVPITRPRVVLLVDRSGSMSENPLGEGTRWEALHGVISEVVSGQDRTTDFGLAMFPAAGAGDTFPEGACSTATALDVPVGIAAGDAIITALPDAQASTHGGTPAAATVELAADHLRGLSGDEPRLLVLITDGAANCSSDSDALTASLYDEALQQAVADAALDGITTYVVGIQISEEFDQASGVVPAEQLDEVAGLRGAPLEGGAHQFYSVADQAALSEAIDSITAELGCSMALGSEVDPERPALLRVGETLRDRVDDCASGDGWTYVDGDAGLSLELCGSTCDDFQATGTIDLEYDCSQ